jgi:hypothetical protein
MDHYVIRVEGAVEADALRDFAQITVAPGSVQTLLYGDLPDQSALAGILDYLAGLGVEIVEVVKMPPESEARRATRDEGE